ncbi:MAG: tetratricopeptide repeat protein, partial [bacterium]|nr:tetratricopeptide repeat protein [bacterium]
MDTIVLDLQNQVEQLRRELEGWRRLGRVIGGVFRRVGSDRLSAEDAAMQIQAALEGRLAVTPVTDGTQPRDRDRDQLISEAHHEIQGGRLDRAIAILTDLHEQYPDDTRLILRLGDCYARSGDVQQALVTYRKVARQYEEQGFFLKAVAVYKQILKLCDTPTEDGRIPKRTVADVRYMLAGLYRRLGLLVDASLMYQSFLEHAEGTDERISTVRDLVAELERS